MSLDEFIAGPDDRPGQELGRSGGRLFSWLDDRMSPGINGQVFGELTATEPMPAGAAPIELVSVSVSVHQPSPDRTLAV